MTARAGTKETREFVREIEAAGGTVRTTKRGHLCVSGPAGRAHVSGRWANDRDRLNARTDVIRYAGLKL